MPSRLRVLCCALLLLLVVPFAACQAKPASPAAAPVALDIKLAGGTVTPNAAVVPVGVGATVTLRITSDHDDTIHVHGFEVEVPVKAGQTVEKTFVADAVGRVEVESHSPAKTIAYLDIT